MNKERLVFEVADGVTTPEAVLGARIELSKDHVSLLKFEIREVVSNSLWIELPEMLDVPRVGDFYFVLVDQSVGSCSCDFSDDERSFPS